MQKSAEGDYEWLCSFFAKRYRWGIRSGTIDREDLMQCARMAIERAKLTYDPAKGIAFSTYASKWIRSYLRHEAQCHGNVVRTDRKQNGEVIPFKRASIAFERRDGSEASILDLMGITADAPDVDDVMDIAWNREELQTGWDKLKPQWQRVMTLRYVDGLTAADTAREIGVCRERIRQIEEKCLTRLREAVH